uniref:mRNA-decapping enzyme 1B-like isoform X2 n=1 Tax=Myxine glutinosa TaxID=7769 RepID=UPI00358E115D
MAGAPVEQVLHISLAALQQLDPYIRRIMDVASQVALYNFNTNSNQWEKTEVEGTLFVYARTVAPFHGFTIMNRLSMNNLMQPITKELDFKLQEPFLLYRIADHDVSIHSIWFYDKKEFLRVSGLMAELTRNQLLHTEALSSNGDFHDPGGGKQVNIMDMLVRAREAFHQTKPEHAQTINGNGTVNAKGLLSGTVSSEIPHSMLQVTTACPIAMEEPHGRRLSVSALFGLCERAQSPQKKGVEGGSKPAAARTLTYERAHDSSNLAGKAQSQTTLGANYGITRTIEREGMPGGNLLHALKVASGPLPAPASWAQPGGPSISSFQPSALFAAGGRESQPSTQGNIVASEAASPTDNSSLYRLLQKLHIVGSPLSSVGSLHSPASSPASSSLCHPSSLPPPGAFEVRQDPLSLLLPQLISHAALTTSEVLLAPETFQQPATPQQRVSVLSGTRMQGSALHIGGDILAAPGGPRSSPYVPDSALTRAQLRDALLHLLQTDEDFLSKIYGAYLQVFVRSSGGLQL